MATRQISAVTTIPIDLPTSCGRVKQNYQGFGRDFMFYPRVQGGSQPEESPILDQDVWAHHNTRIDPDNSLTLSPVVHPRGMKSSDWIVTSDVLNAVTTTKPTDPLGRDWWYIRYGDPGIAATPAQLVGMDATPFPESPVKQFKFKSNFVIPANQRWRFESMRFMPFSQSYHPINASGGLVNMSAPDATGNFTLIQLLEVTGAAAVIADYFSRYFVNIYWGIGSSDGVRWGLHIPGTAVGSAFLMKSVDNGGTWRIVDRYPHKVRAQPVDPDTRPRTIVDFGVANGVASFDFHWGDPVWRFRDPENPNGFNVMDGNWAVLWSGLGGVWVMNDMCFRPADSSGLLGYAEANLSHPDPASTPTHPLPPQTWFSLPSWINSDNADLSIKTLPHNAGTVDVGFTATMIYNPSNAAQYAPRIGFLPTTLGATKGGCVLSPNIHLVQEVRKAKVEVITASQGDLSSTAFEVSWTLNKRFRGNSMSIKAKNFQGQWNTLRGNEFIQLAVAQVTGDDLGNIATGTSYNQFSGFIGRRRVRRDGDSPSTVGWLELECRDWEMRLKKKAMRDMPSFGGWELREALEYICNRAGIGTAAQGAKCYYDFDPTTAANITIGAGIQSGMLLDTPMVTPGGTGHLSFKYTENHNSLHAMDELCASKQMEWGITADGCLRAWPAGYPDTSWNYTLDDTNYNPEVDCVQYLEVTKDMEHFYNISQVYSRGSDGRPTSALIWDPNSVYGNYATTKNYVGDDWWDVHHAPDGTNVNAYAQTRLTSLASYDSLVSWKTDLNLPLMPRQLVTLNISDVNISADKYVVVEKRGRIQIGDGDFVGECEFILGIPRTGTPGT